MANLSKVAQEKDQASKITTVTTEPEVTQWPLEDAVVEAYAQAIDMAWDEAELEQEFRTNMAAKPLAFLFDSSNAPAIVSGANQLQLTAELTRLSTDVADYVLAQINTNQVAYADAVRKAFESHDAMDALINNIYPLSAEMANFLTKASTDDVEKMIRSQQSKRSRAKSKTLNMESLKTMLIGAVAENLLRIVSNQPKKSGGSFSVSYDGFTEAQIEEFRTNEDKLKKAIRNVQSKKSIESHKAGHKVTSDRWISLLAEETMLKSIRDNSTPVVTITPEAAEALEAQRKLKEDFGDMLNADDLSPEEAQRMLKAVKDMLIGK